MACYSLQEKKVLFVSENVFFLFFDLTCFLSFKYFLPFRTFWLVGSAYCALSIKDMMDGQMDWDQRYIDKDMPWDKGAPAPVLQHLLEHRRALFQEGRPILIPGCGAGHDVALLHSHGLNVTGMDISPTALSEAERLYPDVSSEKWVKGDLFKDLSTGAFGMIWEHTCFCAILPDQREDYAETAWKALSANGLLVGVFFHNLDKDHEDGPPFNTPIEELKKHFGKHFVLELEMAPPVHYPGREGKEILMIWRRLASCAEAHSQN